MNKIKVLGFAGSLRKGSANRSLIKNAVKLAPGHIQIETFDLSPIPLFNQDIEKESGEPDSVKEFKSKIAEADSLLIAVPEYNYSVSGVLKNAIDWASRPASATPLAGKPFAMMSAGGGLGGARAQYHFRQIAVVLNMYPLNKPELMVPNSWEKFDRDGNLLDTSVEQKIKNILDGLYEWTIKLKSK